MPPPQQTPGSQRTEDAKVEKPAPTFSGTVVVKIFSDRIGTGGEVAGIDSKLQERIQKRVDRLDGVSNVTVDSYRGVVNVGYSGKFDGIEDIERAVASTSTKCAVISPALVKFRPYANADEEKVAQALKGQSGVIEVIPEKGSYSIYADITAVDLEGLETAAESAGCPGKIVSHDVVRLRIRPEEDADEAGLLEKLGDTKFVLKHELNGDELKVTIVRGRVSKRLIQKLASTCGFKT